MSRRRLDAELVRRGLASSRSEAREAVRAGIVIVAGAPASKASTLVAASDPVNLTKRPRNYVSRGGDKLRSALDRFELDPAGRYCLDAGASTGGFTDCLLRAGAARVVAVDVGYGQLAWRLREDPRVTVLERTNARDLTADVLPLEPNMVVADLSFISLRLVVSALALVADARADFVVLVKPQFEAGIAEVGKGGVVRDPIVWRHAIDGVAQAFRDVGATPLAVMASPIIGPAGNREFLLHARASDGEPTLDAAAAIAEAIGSRP